LNNMGHGQNLSSTSGEPEFVAQQFCGLRLNISSWKD
jgi:hypothetical protein